MGKQKIIVPKSWDNMMICSCEITGNEKYKILVTIQYRRVNNNNHVINIVNWGSLLILLWTCVSY